MKGLLLQLITATHGQGPSSTRLVYLVNGLAAVFCAIVMTMGGIIVYCALHIANSTYWLAVGALWTGTLGFGAKTKSDQQKISKELALAARPMMSTASGD